ncbi:hypothetical protein FB451DRAFT_1175215 [Mycena latifolia]|nr:hypothetical protein FB451DRAFT_1175215 [Mycena latifolia]
MYMLHSELFHALSSPYRHSEMTVLPQDTPCRPEVSIRASLKAQGGINAGRLVLVPIRRSTDPLPRAYILKDLRGDAYNALVLLPAILLPSHELRAQFTMLFLMLTALNTFQQRCKRLYCVVPVSTTRLFRVSRLLTAFTSSATPSSERSLGFNGALTLDFAGELPLECLAIFVPLMSDCTPLASRMRPRCALSDYFMLNVQLTTSWLSEAISTVYMCLSPPNAAPTSYIVSSSPLANVFSYSSTSLPALLRRAAGQYSGLITQLCEDLPTNLTSHGGLPYNPHGSSAVPRAALMASIAPFPRDLAFECTKTHVRGLGGVDRERGFQGVVRTRLSERSDGSARAQFPGRPALRLRYRGESALDGEVRPAAVLARLRGEVVYSGAGVTSNVVRDVLVLCTRSRVIKECAGALFKDAARLGVHVPSSNAGFRVQQTANLHPAALASPTQLTLVLVVPDSDSPQFGLHRAAFFKPEDPAEACMRGSSLARAHTARTPPYDGTLRLRGQEMQGLREDTNTNAASHIPAPPHRLAGRSCGRGMRGRTVALLVGGPERDSTQQVNKKGKERKGADDAPLISHARVSHLPDADVEAMICAWSRSRGLAENTVHGLKEVSKSNAAGYNSPKSSIWQRNRAMTYQRVRNCYKLPARDPRTVENRPSLCKEDQQKCSFELEDQMHQGRCNLPLKGNSAPRAALMAQTRGFGRGGAMSRTLVPPEGAKLKGDH